jgi:hypothetical protein
MIHPEEIASLGFSKVTIEWSDPARYWFNKNDIWIMQEVSEHHKTNKVEIKTSHKSFKGDVSTIYELENVLGMMKVNKEELKK